MTKLVKQVRRVADLRLPGADSGTYAVSLYPSGFIGFRKSRTRREFVITLAACYGLAVRATIAAQKCAGCGRRGVALVRGTCRRCYKLALKTRKD